MGMKTTITLKPITLTFTLKRTYVPDENTFADWDNIPTQKAFESQCMDDFFDEVDLSLGSYQTKSVKRTYQEPVQFELEMEEWE
jgi:hypothetical protein